MPDSININHDVWVRLTGAGRDHVTKADYLGEPVDGWYRFQLWCLMAAIGGHALYNGGPQLIEKNEIRFTDPLESSVPDTPKPYVPEDPTAIVCLAVDVPMGWQARRRASDGWEDSLRVHVGTIVEARPTPRPPVKVEIPAELADAIVTHDPSKWPMSVADHQALMDLVKAAES